MMPLAFKWIRFQNEKTVKLYLLDYWVKYKPSVFLWEIDKQFISRSDSTGCGILSGSSLFA